MRSHNEYRIHALGRIRANGEQRRNALMLDESMRATRVEASE
jgi:hypothetical protein